MEAPLVRYTRTTDGVSIAYWAAGTGPPVVELPGLPHSHIQMEWEIPEWRRGYELAVTARTWVRYDGRGTGLSQRKIAEYSLETFLADLDAVVTDLGVEQVALSGVTTTCPVAIAYAVRHPERVTDLVLWCPVVDGSTIRANRMLEGARKLVEIDWLMFSEAVAHALVGWDEPDLARNYAALIRAGNDQDTILSLAAALHRLDVRDLLPQVRCRTLVLHRPQMALLPAGAAERVAAAIPHAQLALFEGASAAPIIGDWRAISRTIGAFLGTESATAAGASGRRALRLLMMKTEALSPREREIVSLVAQGLTNREIAGQLYLAPKTVENHIGRILVKLNLRSRTQLAAYAVEHGLTGEKTA